MFLITRCGGRPRVGVVELFGGAAPRGGAVDAWSFDGAHWTELTLEAAPAARFGPLVAYVP